MRTASRLSPSQWTAAWLLVGAAAVPATENATASLPRSGERPDFAPGLRPTAPPTPIPSPPADGGSEI